MEASMYRAVVQRREATFRMHILYNINIRICTIQYVGTSLYIQVILAI
jgi:hypothetical protein